MKKKILSLALALCMVLSLCPVAALAANYSDTEGHWAEAAIDRWTGYGVVSGMGDNTFAPNNALTRAQAAQVFTNLLKLDGKADLSGFTDVSADAWYVDAISACVDAGILAGMGNGIISPEGTVTREMFFTMFARALGIQADDTLDRAFTDADSISSWARGSVYALANKGYIHGMTAFTIVPGDNINRASVMALLDQTVVEYVTKDGTYTVDEDGVVLVLADSVTISGSGDVDVVVVKEGASVSLSGATGSVEVTALADDVTVTDAPAGTTITAAEGVTGVTANGTAVDPGSEITIPATTSSNTGGGSTITPSTGGTDDDDTGDDEEEDNIPTEDTTHPVITVDGKEYEWNDEEEEYVYTDEDGKEVWLDADEAKTVTAEDGKEYVKGDDGEWHQIGDDGEEEEQALTTEEMLDEIMNAANSSEALPDEA